MSVDRRHVDAGAERRIDDIDRFNSVEIGAVPFEARIVGRVNDDEEVACRKSRLFRGQTAAWHAQRHAFLHPHGNAHGEDLIAQNLSLAAALRARHVDEGAAAFAIRACRDLLHSDAALALAANELPAAAALWAGARLRAGLRAGALAGLARDGPADMHRLLPAVEDAFQRHGNGDLDILAPPRRGAAAEKAIEWTHSPEIKAETPEDVLEIDAAEQILGGEVGDAGIAARIVLRALLGIAQDRVGLGDLLEAIGCARFLVPVGVVLQGELAESVLDRLLVGVSRNAEHLVIIARVGHGLYRSLARAAAARLTVFGVDHPAAGGGP